MVHGRSDMNDISYKYLNDIFFEEIITRKGIWETKNEIGSSS